MDLTFLGELPACGTACVAEWCSPLVESCFCPDRTPHAYPWSPDLTNCLETNCTFSEQIVSCGVTWDVCNVPLAEISLTPLIIVTFIVQLCAFSIRVWSTFIRSVKLGLDDISITLAFFFLVCFVPILSMIEHYGFYENVYTGNVHNLDKTTITFFVHKIFYALSMGWAKISIVFLYFRILEGRKSRIVLWATQVANVLVMCSFIIALGFACKPIWSYWAFSFDVEGAKCNDLWDWGGYYTAFNLLLDIWMVIVPVYTIYGLQMDKKVKLGVIAMFCLGFVTMVMTVMRFVEMRKNADTFLADDIMDGLVWSTLEPTTAFLVACMPAIRLVLRARMPSIRNSITFIRSAGGSHRVEAVDPISSSRRDYPPAYGYRRTEDDSRRGLFDTSGALFEMSPIKSIGMQNERELPREF